MTKKTIGIFFIISIIMDLIGVAMIIGGLVGSTFATTTNGYSTNTQVTSFGNLPLFITGVIIVSLSAIPYLVAWIGALVNLARLHQWAWFVFMILFNWITLLVYVIVGPTTPSAIQSYRQSLPPQNYPQPPQYNPQQTQNYPQPPQNYPQPPQYNPQQTQNYPQPPQDYPQS